MKLTYRPEIDGLRAIAVGAVILYHAQINIFGHQPFKGGFIGVDIFFVISGYLITSIILKELVTTGSFSFKHFYERRIRRILPALLFVMLASLPFAWMYLLPSSFVDFSKSILYSLGFSSNFYFHYSGQQYGAESGLLKPFLHTWSLSVEEQYYILFPIVLLVTFKYFKKYLIHILILGFVISLGLADWGSRNHPSFNFYVLPTRMWELLAGSILAYFEITKGYRSKYQAFNLIMPSIGLFLIGHSFLFFNDKIFHPSFYTLSPIIGVCLIIWFSSKNEMITKILSTKLFVGVGLISYSLYLWHYPIFAFTRISLGFKTFNNYSFYFILLNFILSILTYFIIEKKFRDIFYFKFKYILVLIFLSYIILGMISLLGFKGFLFTDKQKAFLNLRIGNSLPINNFDTNDKIILIGDSHAESIFFDLNKKLKNISHFTNYYYQDLFFIDPKTKKNLDQFNILKKTKKINDFIKKKKNKELILILFLRPSYLYHNSFFINDLGDKESEYRFNYNRKPEVILQNIEDIILDDNSRKEIIKLSLKKTINIMLENNHKVILVYPMPEVGFHVPKKFIKKNFFSLEIMSTSYDFYVKRNEWLFNIYDEYNHKNIYRVYPHKLFCSTVIEQRCIVNTKNKLFYRDTDHPSEEGAKMINNLILKEIEKIELKYN